MLTTLAAALLFATAAGASNSDADWPQFRGPAAVGVEVPAGLPAGAFGLTTEWQRELGAGYANVSIAGGKIVTAFASGAMDVIAAFDAETGDELWRVEIAETYEGHDGSDDGPISTPTIDRGVVYYLGPLGQLLALDLETGEKRWQYDLDQQNSTTPFYGYTTSPVIHDDSVIVASGGEGHALTALGRFTGEPKWMAGDDTVAYHTPSLVELNGKTVLIAATNQWLQGFDPDTGEILWRLQHTEGNRNEESAHVTAAGDDRFLVKYGTGSKLYRVAGDSIEQVWESRAFGRGLAIPVKVGDHFYGLTGAILTCVEVDTGEIVWRSREPGGLGLTAVGDRLSIIDPEGNLVIVNATPEGYSEVTRLKVLETGDHAFPAFAGDTFLVRNLESMASVRVDPDLDPNRAPVQITERLGAFGAWVDEITAMPASRRQAAVDRRFGAIDRTPIVEDDGTTHFVFRGDAEDVGLNGDPVGNQEVGMERIEGTDLFFHSLELDPAGQYLYQLTVDYGTPSTDPTNPFQSNEGFTVFSDLRMPGWPEMSHVEEPAEDTPRGELDRFPFRSAALGNTRQIQVWRPADYDADPNRRYPVLVVNHGDRTLQFANLGNTFDNLVGKTVDPFLAVLVPRLETPEYGGERADLYNRFLIEELLPHIDRHYRTDGASRAIMGPGSAGVASVYAALAHPDEFSRAAAHSFYPDDAMVERVDALTADAPMPEKVFVGYSDRDYDFGNTLSAEEASERLIERLRARDVETLVVTGAFSTNWGGWKAHHDDILEAFFPLSTDAD